MVYEDAADRDLALRAAAGDHVAFDTLMLRHQQSLIRWIWSLVGDADEAQDIAQDAFLQAYHHRSNYNPRFAFKTWLYTIARNRALSVLRKRKRQVAEIGTPAHGETASAEDMDETWASLAASEDADPREQAVASERAEWLRMALDRLDEPHAEVLRLKYFSGLKSREIAELLGLEVGTVWSRVHHGLRKLRALAKEVGHGAL